MELALASANWLLDKVVSKLKEDLVAAYLSSSELGPNLSNIHSELSTARGLLEAARKSGVTDDGSVLHKQLEELRGKADEAEDALDELHYYLIRDNLDGTNKFDPWVPNDGLRGQAFHGRQALRHTVGNYFSCFSRCCRRTQDEQDNHVDDLDALIRDPHGISKAKSGTSSNNGSDVDQPDRVAMSMKIKSVIEDMRPVCKRVSNLLKVSSGGARTVVRPVETVSSMTPHEKKMYGRERIAIFNQTISDMTSANPESLPVLPIFGIPGIGKTTFAKHLYDNEKIKRHFTVRSWVCVSTDFDVAKLTKNILGNISDDKNQHSYTEPSSLEKLQESVRDRMKSERFLVVLDDIWEYSWHKWDTLLSPLRDTGHLEGSMVLVTTRHYQIAEKVKNTIDSSVIHLKDLENTAIMDYFKEYLLCKVPDGPDKEDMIEIAEQIAAKLKGSPLAATAVGELLKDNFSLKHWNGILTNHKWLDDKDGILPALKISYEYLPSHLKACFPYFGLFPQDYSFHNLNITQFWFVIGVIGYSDQDEKPPEVTGLEYLNEFVDRGFLMKKHDGLNPTFVMHDLFHELSQSVSSDCANISSITYKDHIPRSIRHLSITLERKYDETFVDKIDKLEKTVDIGSLRSLMFFGYISESFVNSLEKILRKTKSLRILSIIVRSSYAESWLQNCSRLIHLQYLSISRAYESKMPPISMPSTISTLHHLKFLEIDADSCTLPSNLSRLVSLRHFRTRREFHSNVPEVGKMKYLQELKQFHVKKESEGFELDQLGELKDIRGELCVCGLEKVETMEEATKADLKHKKNLCVLTLKWAEGTKLETGADNVIDGFEPHPDLIALHIHHHPGVVGPKWLCRDVCTKSLEFLSLDSISWRDLPPFALLPYLKYIKLRSITGMPQFGPVTSNSLRRLKTIEFESMPDLIQWVGGVNSNLFSSLEIIKCSNCPKLSRLPFSECTGRSKPETMWFPKLCRLIIEGCPELTLPPLPHTSTLTDILLAKEKALTDILVSKGPTMLKYKERSLSIMDYSGALAFENLDKVEKIHIRDPAQISLTDLRKLYTLSSLSIKEVETDFLFSGEPSDNFVLPSVQNLRFETVHPMGKLLPHLLKCLPNILKLNLSFSVKKLNYEEQQDLFQYTMPVSLRYKINRILLDEAKDEEQVLPQLPFHSSLRVVTITRSRNIVLPLEDGGGLAGLTSLESLSFEQCDKIFSQWSAIAVSDRIISLFPASLRELTVEDVPCMWSMGLIQNLTSLTKLSLIDCPNLTMDGFDPHMTLNLKELSIYNNNHEEMNRSVATEILTEVARSDRLGMAFFSQLECLSVDCIATVLVDPICKLLSAKLHSLVFRGDKWMERFTDEQDTALQQLVSLEILQFKKCPSLECLPEGLHGLRSLKRMAVHSCNKIRSLPGNSLPTSLERLDSLGNNKEFDAEVRKFQELVLWH